MPPNTFYLLRIHSWPPVHIVQGDHPKEFLQIKHESSEHLLDHQLLSSCTGCNNVFFLPQIYSHLNFWMSCFLKNVDILLFAAGELFNVFYVYTINHWCHKCARDIRPCCTPSRARKWYPPLDPHRIIIPKPIANDHPNDRSHHNVGKPIW